MTITIKRSLQCCASLCCALLLAMATSRAAETMTTRPDFTGVWLPNARASGRWPEVRPYTPAIAAKQAQWIKATAPIDLMRDDSYTSCIPYTLPYMMTTITQYPFEIVMAPHRIYLFTEVFGQVRRIYLDGTAPADALPSRTGISRGRWEGSQLVVETTNILPQNESDRYPGSRALRVVERFSLQGAGNDGRQLVNEITIIDPPVYGKPVVVRMVHKSATDVQVGEYICEQDLWDQHLDGNRSQIPWR
jgi:hypothetical protein